jgi:hypothetical protein
MIPVFQFHGKPLTEKNSEALLSLLMVVRERPESEVPFRQDNRIKDEFLCRVMALRIEHYPLPFDMSNMFVVMSFLCGVDRPGIAMGLLWIAHCQAKKRGKTLLTLHDWCEIFPWGFPSYEEWEKWWDSQKVMREDMGMQREVNLVDYKEEWN